MRKLFVLLFAALLSLGVCCAQQVTDGGFKTIGYIKSDGTVQDAGYRTIGHIKSDGTIQDGGFKTIGHVKSDGTVQDSGFKTIGHANGIKREWAAWFFFFRK